MMLDLRSLPVKLCGWGMRSESIIVPELWRKKAVPLIRASTSTRWKYKNLVPLVANVGAYGELWRNNSLKAEKQEFRRQALCGLLLWGDWVPWWKDTKEKIQIWDERWMENITVEVVVEKMCEEKGNVLRTNCASRIEIVGFSLVSHCWGSRKPTAVSFSDFAGILYGDICSKHRGWSFTPAYNS